MLHVVNKNYTFDTIKKILMFLAFPYTEVFYVAAIVLAWVYIALGIMGSQQTPADEVSIYKNANQVQENHFQITENIKINDRTYFWSNQSEFAQAEFTKDPPLYCYCITNIIQYYQRPEFFHSSCLDSNIPNRAPPVI